MQEYTVYINGQEIRGRDGHPATEISPLVSLGLSQDDAVEMLNHRKAGNSRYAAIVTSAVSRGVTRAQIDEALAENRHAHATYIETRRAGAGHQEALTAIRGLHVCMPAETTANGTMNPVLGTGEVVRRTLCSCGKELYRSVERRNWSGD